LVQPTRPYRAISAGAGRIESAGYSSQLRLTAWERMGQSRCVECSSCRARTMPPTDQIDAPDGQGWAWFFSQINALRPRKLGSLSRRLEMARRFLDTHLDEPLSLDEIARHAHLSKFHFLRLFRDAFRETPLRYLRRRRLEAARLLLTRTDLSV